MNLKHISYLLIFLASLSRVYAQSPVTVYQHSNYEGKSMNLEVGDLTMADLQSTVGNDAISSIKVEKGYRLTLFEHKNHEGRSLDITHNTSTLSRLFFDNIASSAKVTNNEDNKKIANPSMEDVYEMNFPNPIRKIKFNKGIFPLDYHSIAGKKWQHLQDMLRLPNANEKEYYMGTFSQNTSNEEGGLVFVGEVNLGENEGKVIWADELNNRHPAGGFNHPGDLRILGNTVIIAGQNWKGTWKSDLGTFFGGDDMKIGDGGQAVLFYDVSNPVSPIYSGKVNGCWDDDTFKSISTDLSEVSTAKFDDFYYLSFNGLTEDSGLKCMNFDRFTSENNKDSGWLYINDTEDDYSSSIQYKYVNETIVGGARLSDSFEESFILFDQLESIPGNIYKDFSVKRLQKASTKISNHSFGTNTTFSLTAIGGGKSAVVYSNVRSDDFIEIEVLESGNPMPITDLKLVYNDDNDNKKYTQGYTQIPVNLNRNVGLTYNEMYYKNETRYKDDYNSPYVGDRIYLWYSKDPKKDPITGIKIQTTDDKVDQTTLSKYIPVRCSKNEFSDNEMCDINSGVGGKYIAMYYTRDQSKGKPIKDVSVIEDENKKVPIGFSFIDNDLNAGVKGSYLYLIYARL